MPEAELSGRDRSPVDEVVDARQRPVRLIAVCVGGFLVALVAVLVWARPGGQIGASPVVGQPVPPVAGVALDGSSFDIDDHRGRWVIVNLFATWCVPCQVEHPELVAFDEEHRASGEVQLVSVVFGDRDEEVRAFFAERGGDWPVLGEEYSSIAVDFGATGVPETYVVAPSGVVVEQILGGVTQARLNEIIDAYR